MPPIITSVPSGSAPTVRSVQLRDWTGGLNLRDDAMQLAVNETGDCLNVDITAQGGFQRRATVRNATSAAFGSANPTWLTQFVGNSVNQILVGNQAAGVDKLHYFTAVGGAPTAVALSGATTTAAWRSAAAARITSATSERLYIQRNAAHVVARWNGTAITDLGDAVGNYNENVAAPAGGYMPKAKLICSHLGYMFHANILETATTHANRIRWSHPGEPEDYKSLDYIDVGAGEDSDAITAIVSHGGALYIFKDRSTWLLTGFDADTFALRRIADVGAISQEAVSASSYGLAAFDTRLGVHAVAPSGAVPLWNKLNPALADGTIQSGYLTGITVGWLGTKLYVSVPWGSGVTVNNRTFVFDPFVGKGGAWTVYSLGFFRLLEWRRTGVASVKLGCEAGHPTYFHQIDAGATTDCLTGTTETTFDAYLFTAWVDAGAPALKKRWRRFSCTFDQQRVGDSMDVRVWKNWSTKGSARYYQLAGTAAAGAGLVWDSGVWGDPWIGSIDGDQATVRGGTIGTAYSVTAKVTGPLDKAWGLNAIEFRYVPQRIN